MNINSEILKTFGERVRQLRKVKDISQEELAHRADLHRTYIGMIERAEKNIKRQRISSILSKSLRQRSKCYFLEFK